MPIQLNHTIVAARDKEESALFLAEILGLAPPVRLGHFAVVTVGETSLDFVDADGDITRPYGSGGTSAEQPNPLIAPSIES